MSQWLGCDAYDCPATALFEFTVGQRPPGIEGPEGWPAGAPDLRAPLALHIPSAHRDPILRPTRH